MPKRIVFFFSDTGGGHRSAAEAIIEALRAEHGQAVELKMVDVFKQYMPRPLNRVPEAYPTMINRGRLAWGVNYWLTNGPTRVQAASRMMWPYWRSELKRCVRENPADVYVNVHPLLGEILRGMGPGRPPFITVVTDLVTVHTSWFSCRADQCVVPTEAVRALALRAGYAPEQVHVTGLPVSGRFSAPVGDKAALKARLGWGTDRPVVLVVGGGEGMGPLYNIAQAISSAGLNCELAVVAGRNQTLRARLEAAAWQVPTHIYGFVREMPDFMRAAEVLVTKAGPGTICEALNTGLPLILYSRIPGQEAGNVSFVVEGQAGVWAPGSRRVVAALRQWIGPEVDSALFERVAANARRLARPNAARDIAALISARLC